MQLLLFAEDDESIELVINFKYLISLFILH